MTSKPPAWTKPIACLVALLSVLVISVPIAVFTLALVAVMMVVTLFGIFVAFACVYLYVMWRVLVEIYHWSVDAANRAYNGI